MLTAASERHFQSRRFIPSQVITVPFYYDHKKWPEILGFHQDERPSLQKCTYWLTVVCMALPWTLNFLFSLPGFWQWGLSLSLKKLVSGFAAWKHVDLFSLMALHHTLQFVLNLNLWVSLFFLISCDHMHISFVIFVSFKYPLILCMSNCTAKNMDIDFTTSFKLWLILLGRIFFQLSRQFPYYRVKMLFWFEWCHHLKSFPQ